MDDTRNAPTPALTLRTVIRSNHAAPPAASGERALEQSVIESVTKKSFTHRTDAHIYTGQVPCSAVLVCYNRRVEAEVLVDDALRHLEIERVA